MGGGIKYKKRAVTSALHVAPKRLGHTMGAINVQRNMSAISQELAILAHVEPKPRSMSNTPVDAVDETTLASAETVGAERGGQPTEQSNAPGAVSIAGAHQQLYACTRGPTHLQLVSSTAM